MSSPSAIDSLTTSLAVPPAMSISLLTDSSIRVKDFMVLTTSSGGTVTLKQVGPVVDDVRVMLG